MHENPVVGLFYFPNTRKLSIWSMAAKQWVQFGALCAEPLPPGEYFIGAPGRHARVGEAMPLLPRCGTATLPETWRHTGVFIHGGCPQAGMPGIVPTGIAITGFVALAEALRAIWSDRLAIKVLPPVQTEQAAPAGIVPA
jgi:hypothetical protein